MAVYLFVSAAMHKKMSLHDATMGNLHKLYGRFNSFGLLNQALPRSRLST
jgi:hypothetical protein